MPLRRWIVVCLLAALCVAAGGCAPSAAQPAEWPAAAALPVTVATAEQRAVPYLIRAAGTVESTDSVAIVPRVDGPIVRVLVNDGQDVSSGDPLVQIDPQPYDIHLRIATANLMRDAAQLEDASAKEKHGRALLDQHFISDDDYLLLKTTRESGEAAVEADRAARDQAQLQLDYTTIRAPVAGRIGHVALQIGSMLRATLTAPLTTINVLDSVDVVFAAPERELGRIRHALDAHASTVSIPLDDAATLRGSIDGDLDFIDNAVDSANGTIRLRARVDNRARVLWPGQFVTVDLSLLDEPAATVVPSIAVEQGPEGPYVFVVDGSLVAEQRPVVVTRTADPDALVTGVQPGERVVLDGQARLAPGANVSIRNAPPST